MPHEISVLMSGGLDSATVAALLVDQGRSAHALFVDYGQPAANEERAASKAVARHYGVQWTEVTFRGLGCRAPGEIRGRNDLLIAAALAASQASLIAIGTHSGTPYRDCSQPHASAWQALLEAEYLGERRLFAPLLEMTKGEVVSLARQLLVPVDMTRSCELPGAPCGDCPSCLDRELARVDA